MSSQPMTGPTLDPSYGKEPTPETVSNPLPCLQTGTYHKFLLRDGGRCEKSTAKHQLKPGESCGRVFVRSELVGTVRDMTRRPTELTNLGSWGLRENGLPSGNMQSKTLAPLPIFSKCTSWSLCGFPNKWSWGCLRLFSLALNSNASICTAWLCLSGRGSA